MAQDAEDLLARTNRFVKRYPKLAERLGERGLGSRPDIVRDLVRKHGAFDSTQRGTAMAEFAAMTPRRSQHNPGEEIPEEHWAYRFAKKHWFFGFGAYS